MTTDMVIESRFRVEYIYLPIIHTAEVMWANSASSGTQPTTYRAPDCPELFKCIRSTPTEYRRAEPITVVMVRARMLPVAAGRLARRCVGLDIDTQFYSRDTIDIGLNATT